MKKIFLQLTAIAVLLLQACGQSKPLEEKKLEKYDLTITMPKTDEVPEFQDFKASETDTELSDYDFHISDARVSLTEISASSYPTDTTMLKKAVTGSADFMELIETKQLKNGAFGTIFKMKGSSGAPVKNYLFYFKKGNRFFKMEPIFNNDLKELDLQLAAFESLK
ncbi:hypothetical protein DBR32_11250 [Taibaiella sp. KBW10]|uniref:hypothetical protein n=1 Tax=Taibaiella sp. KBW10 TaxID=2153357 RepID=UPI000F5ADC46|nr:hypothetical protein [Taibaiella sp. KBW10]RQO30154.1 hypothetical protein DBR32_11250 [Taibaiella sp. KBW10]